ncbi:sulfite reductase subunit alpha [Edaphobacter bradus]|uniref:sulfite reductase subunit alpha n=1 Tax=Edaphobacter bradus TaxID=2259016 RepID=UPI0021E0C0C2|nr:sulfite reductase subunit alpha [Edaphobacter bradus]
MNTPEGLVPRIPEEAPFTQAQRAWLNGFIAGLYSYAPAPAPPAQKPLRIAVLYGSQTGTAEGLARKLAKELKAAGFEIALNSLEGYVPATLAEERYALFIVSTYGEGEAPDPVQPFFQHLCVQHFPLLGNLSYGLLALGDSHYEQFCQFGRDLDAKLDSLGAVRLMDRVESDVDVKAPFAKWKEAVEKRLREIARQAPPVDPVSATVDDAGSAAEASLETVVRSPMPTAHTRENPYIAPVAEKRPLTHPSSTKQTIHLSFAIDDSSVRYEAGDACGVVPQNSPELVDAVLGQLPFSGNEPVEIPKAGTLPLRQALLERLAITRLSRNMLKQYGALTQCTQLQTLLLPEKQDDLERYLHGRDLVDLLKECPGAFSSPDEFVTLLPKLMPRLYSISSSPSAHRGQVHTTVSIVRYRTYDRDRGGVCSTLLADRVNVGDRLPLYIQPNKKFRLPQDPTASVIMIGPGTGIAPFRAFLHERRATAATGRNWLFFGERSAATDFLYREELENMRSDGHLTQLDTAFSRDQKEKVYVQDLMQQNAQQLWAWLDEGAFIYVCGDATRMARDVSQTLHRIVQEQGGMSEEESENYVNVLGDTFRYQRDVY